MIKYIFNEKEYDSLWEIRFENPELVFSDDDESLSLLGIVKKELPDPEIPFEQLKQQKISDLQKIVINFENNYNPDMYFNSSLGFKVNADPRSLRNAQTLYSTFDVIGQRKDDKLVVPYNDYDGQLHFLSKEEIQKIYTEIAIYGQSLYIQKDKYFKLIKEATNKEELNAIKFDFSHDTPKLNYI